MIKEPLHNLSGKRALRIGMGCKAANRSNSRSYCEDLQHRRPPETADASGAVDYAEVPKLPGRKPLRRGLAVTHRLATIGLGVRRVSTMALTAVLMVLITPPRAAHANTAQEQLQHFVSSVTAASGEFVQTPVADASRPDAQATSGQSGVFAFQRPGKFRWEVLTPYAQLVVSDGTHVFQYDPDLAQVTERSLNLAMGASPAAILFGTARFDEAFTVSDLPDQEGLAWLRAQPRESDAGFTHMDIAFRNGLPIRLLLLDVFGQTTRIDFAQMQVHATLPADTFRFDIPAGVDVVRMP